jgi:hypothetical protein
MVLCPHAAWTLDKPRLDAKKKQKQSGNQYPWIVREKRFVDTILSTASCGHHLFLSQAQAVEALAGVNEIVAFD